MTTQHTAAPWETLEIHDGIAIKDSRNVTIAYCGYATEADDIELDKGETEANARLIAAAPDMLEALEDAEEIISSLMAIHEEDETDVPSIVTIRAAIAKAKGGAA
jgi:hypothetical protein